MTSNGSVITQENIDVLRGIFREEIESYIEEYEREEGGNVPNKEQYIAQQVDLVVHSVLDETFDPKFDLNDLDSFSKDSFRVDIGEYCTVYEEYAL